MLPKKDLAATKKSQQVISRGICFKAAGVKSAVKSDEEKLVATQDSQIFLH